VDNGVGLRFLPTLAWQFWLRSKRVAELAVPWGKLRFKVR